MPMALAIAGSSARAHFPRPRGDGRLRGAKDIAGQDRRSETKIEPLLLAVSPSCSSALASTLVGEQMSLRVILSNRIAGQ